MQARVLPAAEWDRLAETGLDLTLWLPLDRQAAQIVVVEDAGAIVACWSVMAVRHVEGFWVHPAHRQRGGALRRLFVGMRTLLRSLGATAVVTHAATPDIAALLRAAGATDLGPSFLLPVDFGPWRATGRTSCH
jgi:hypothetical protein